MPESDNKNGGVSREQNADNSMLGSLIGSEKTLQEQISSLADNLLSSNSNVADLDFKYPPPAIRTFIRHASCAQLTGILLDVLIALNSQKDSTDKAR